MKLEHVEYLPNQRKRLHLRCPACGQLVVRAGFGSVKSKTCGCVRYTKHGLAYKTTLYQVWKGMKSRCYNHHNEAWSSYGGRGILVCTEWLAYPSFHAWAIGAGWKNGLVLDRKDNDGDYEPTNCRFVTILQSNRNRKFCITAEQASAVHALLKLKIPQRKIAEFLGVKLWTVRNIARGLCWKE